MELDSKEDSNDPQICVQLGHVQISLRESIWNYHSPAIKAMIGDARKRATVPDGSRLLITLQLRHDPQAFAKLEPLLRLVGATTRGTPVSKPLPSYKLEEVFFWKSEPDTKLIQCLKELFPLTIDSSKMPQEHLDTFNGKTLIMSVLTILTELRMESMILLISVYYAALFKQILKLPNEVRNTTGASTSAAAPVASSTSMSSSSFSASMSSSSVPSASVPVRTHSAPLAPSAHVQLAVAPPQVVVATNTTTQTANNGNTGPAPMDIC